MSGLQELGKSGLLLGAGTRKELSSSVEVRDREFDFNCEQALIAEAIGERSCPSYSRWAVFTMGGAIIGALTGRALLPPRQDITNIEGYTWEALQQAVQENPNKLDPAFIGAVLRNFSPSYSPVPLGRPSQKSIFGRHWSSLEYPDTTSYSVCNIRRDCINQGHRSFELLPEGVKDSIRQVALYMPVMLDIAVSRIHTT